MKATGHKCGSSALVNHHKGQASLASLTLHPRLNITSTSLLRSSKQTLARPFTKRTHKPLFIRAAASPVAAPSASPTGTLVFDRTYPLNGTSSLHVVVSQGPQGEQNIVVSTSKPGRLLLHWGVEGGRGYKGGWRLPGEGVRPTATMAYKNRALRTAFQPAADGGCEVRMTLKGDERSDFLDFVVKDESTDVWYDFNGSNYQIPLKAELVNLKELSSESEEEEDEVMLLPLSAIPALPQDLSGVWAYMKWEYAGCPNRSQEEADREYQKGLDELTMLLRKGVSIDELKGVAAAGVGRYSDFIASHQPPSQKNKQRKASSSQQQAAVQQPPPPQQQEPEFNIPEPLVNLQAYLLWEQAGRPDGADFSNAARESITAHLRNGGTLQEIEDRIKTPPTPPPAPAAALAPVQQQQQAVHQEEVRQEQPPPPPPLVVQQAQPADVYLGDSIGIRGRNPLDLVHRSIAPKLKEKPSTKETPLGPLVQAAAEDENVCWYRTYTLGSKAELLCVVRKSDASTDDCAVEVVLTTDAADDIVLHWGVKKAGKRGEWQKPEESFFPANTEMIKNGIAAETPLTSCDEEECCVEIGGAAVPLQRLTIDLPKGHGLTALTFVLRSEDGTRWWNDGGSNYNIPVPTPVKEAKGPASFNDEISRIIVDAEVNSGGWTLMHRYNKAAELTSEVMSGRFAPSDEAMASIFVWLRYSAIRQLTWQRNYNTQPRILGAAQERLTHVLADAYTRLNGSAREWARLCLPAIGRGGNAQAVRDEILNIMHRNKISEVKGTWMEEFHQKLHNNTTPDDVPICEAYLAFLHSNGNLGAYWRTLSDNGISKARLESFDRAIVTDPVFWPEKKDNLIGEFSNYLKILKDVHSGADLQASASAAAPHVPNAAKGYLGYVLSHSNDAAVLPLLEAAVEARTELSYILNNGNNPNRELLYLDLALENVVRATAERGAAASGTSAAALIAPLLQNLALSLADNEEVCYCLKAWLELPDSVKRGQRPSKDDALKTMAVLDRIRRALATVSDSVSAAISPIATSYGQAMGCDPWAVDLFAEEVVRGGPAFAVSLALSSVEPAMRAAAELGSWQVISPGSVVGVLEVVPDLADIQDKMYDVPTVLLAKNVSGEEEIPHGVVGLLSGDAPDVLSHLSVRSRNMDVLFAACYDPASLDKLAKDLNGQCVKFSSTAAGAVRWEESTDCTTSGSSSDGADGNGSSSGSGFFGLKFPQLSLSTPKWCGKWALGMDSFADGVVGAKSKNLAGLRGKLPEYIGLPASVTLPFGSFEQVLQLPENKETAAKLAAAVDKVTPSTAAAVLAQCRELAMQVVVPAAVQKELQTAMESAGIPVPASEEQWKASLKALKGVWASKYNDRAYVSTRKVGIPFDSVRMAVLCQRIVPATYAFVIHTANPTNGDENEVYCELVRGLGEAIVSGTVPGAALAFVARKDLKDKNAAGGLESPKVLLYPSKSEGMFVDESLIFRSDSNGEDLEGYAGAGLYESITTAETVRRIVDYSADLIVADAEFRRKLMSSICKVGVEIENALGTAQDIEGVVGPDGKVTVVQTRPQM